MLFAAGPVLHMQYTATTEQGRTACVTDLVMERAIDLARRRGHRFFDFGVSTPHEGWCLDEGLYEFKISFGPAAWSTTTTNLTFNDRVPRTVHARRSPSAATRACRRTLLI